MRSTLLLLFLFLLSSSGWASGTERTEQGRARAIEESLLAPCCYGGPVSTHTSGVAGQMRQEIEQMVAEGKSDDEIRQFYVQRYGEQVLAEPAGTKRVVLYAFPVGVMILCLTVVLVFLKHALQRPRRGPVRLDGLAEPVALERVRDEVDQE